MKGKIIIVNAQTYPDKQWSPTNWPPFPRYIGDDDPSFANRTEQERRYENDIINEEGGEANIRT